MPQFRLEYAEGIAALCAVFVDLVARQPPNGSVKDCGHVASTVDIGQTVVGLEFRGRQRREQANLADAKEVSSFVAFGAFWPRRASYGRVGRFATSTVNAEGIFALSLQSMGRIDIHSHLIPGIDDGCRTLDESVECIRQLQAQGYVGTICTPHVWPSLFPQNIPVNIQLVVEQLARNLRSLEIDYQIWVGGEVRLADDTIETFESFGVPSLGDSQYLLCDYWGESWPSEADEALDYLLKRGYRPILAHPERMALPTDEWTRVLADLNERGVVLQGNFRSFAGKEGEMAKERAELLFEQDAYYLFAMDMHRPDGLADRFAGLQMLEERLGSAKLNLYLEQRPREILTSVHSAA